MGMSEGMPSHAGYFYFMRLFITVDNGKILIYYKQLMYNGTLTKK